MTSVVFVVEASLFAQFLEHVEYHLYYHNNSFSFTFDLAAFPSFLSTTVTLESLLAVDDTICMYMIAFFVPK